MKKVILHPVGMLVIGLALGVLSRLLDIYTTNLGNIFSQFAIWILFGVLISIYSSTKRTAMYNVFPFCMGMLLTYYGTAMLTDGVYSHIYIVAWTVFAFCSPIFARFAWLTKEKGLFPKLIGVGIVLAALLSSVIFFDRLRIYDLVIDGLLVYFLFFKRIEREIPGRAWNGQSKKWPFPSNRRKL